MTPKESAKVVFTLLAGFPNGDRARDETREIYEKMLSDLPFDVAERAVFRLLQSSRFLPTISEVREAAFAVEHGLKRTGLEAWGDVVWTIRAVGSYRIPAFEDPIVARVVAAMSWQEVCLGDNESSLRARFVDAYEAIQDRERHELAMSEPLRLTAGPTPAALPARGMARFGAIIPALARVS